MLFRQRHFTLVISLLLASAAHGFTASPVPVRPRTKCNAVEPKRRSSVGSEVPLPLDRRAFVSGTIAGSIGAAFPRRAQASRFKSRNDGYTVTRSDDEWQLALTPRQYDVLRRGGTELPYSSAMEGESRLGIYECAGCGTALFESGQKFHSGTGWPSFGAGLASVEVEEIKLYQRVNGAEMRCGTCGGHLGDVFSDGFLFVGTPGAKSGKRFCVDGSALVFRSRDGEEVVGDQALFPWLRR